MTQECSTRLKERITSPMFFETDEEMNLFINEQRLGSFSFSVEVQGCSAVTFFGLIDENQSPQTLIAMKYSSEEKNSFTGLMDAYIDLITNKDEMKIANISFREIESFLRDQNNVPALGDKSNLAYAFFEKAKAKLLELFNGAPVQVSESERKSPTIKNDYTPQEPSLLSKYEGKTYSDLDSNQKQLLIAKITEEFISPKLARDGGGASIVFADSSMVVIDYLGACASCNYSLSNTLSFIQQVYRYETKNHSLLVMTDS